MYYCTSFALKESAPKHRRLVYLINLIAFGVYALVLVANAPLGFFFSLETPDYVKLVATLKELRDCSGTQLDPAIVDAFLALCAHYSDSIREHLDELAILSEQPQGA